MEGAPARKRTSGCLIAVLIVLGCGVVAVIGCGFLAWRLASSTDGQRVVKMVGDSASIMYRAQSAPGAKEVRRAGNCDQAFVLTAADVAKLANDARNLADGGVDADSESAPGLVTCQVGVFWTPPTCDLLARTYADAAHPAGRFVIEVKKAGGLQSVCQVTFERDGSRLRAR